MSNLASSFLMTEETCSEGNALQKVMLQVGWRGWVAKMGEAVGEKEGLYLTERGGGHEETPV